jgi:hypothetical protein
MVTSVLNFLKHLVEGAGIALVLGFIAAFVDDAAEQHRKKWTKASRFIRPSTVGSAVKKGPNNPLE